MLSVTQIHGGEAYNVIPDRAVIRGTVRCLGEATRQRIAGLVEALAKGVAATHGATAEITYTIGYPATINAAGPVRLALDAAGAVGGLTEVKDEIAPSMGSEDFSYMLGECPGAYAWIGADGAEPGVPLHNPAYDFNDAVLPLGAAYWATLATRFLHPR